MMGYIDLQPIVGIVGTAYQIQSFLMLSEYVKVVVFHMSSRQPDTP